jgi:MscS family membrane protein
VQLNFSYIIRDLKAAKHMNIFEFLLGKSDTAVLLSTGVIVITAFLVGALLKRLLLLVSGKIAKKSRSQLDDMLLNEAARHITGVMLLGTAYWALSEAVRSIQPDPPFIHRLAVMLTEAFFIVLVLYLALVLARLFDTVIRWYLHAVAVRTETHLDDELAPLVNRVLKVLILFVAVIIILDHFGQNISTLVVSLGVGSLAIALAAQETLANMIAGFVLMLDRPFRVGDRIRLPDGTIGNVTDVGIRSTKVIDDNHVMIITPNAEIVKSQIKNFSYPNDVVRFDVKFGVAYGTDLDAMRAIILERIRREEDIVDKEHAEVRIEAMADSSVNAALLCRIRNPNNIPRRRSDLLLVIYNTLREHGIEIPFPQRVLHFAQQPVRISDGGPSGNGGGHG